MEGSLKGGENVLFGLKEGGVGLAPYHDWDSKIPAEIKAKVDAAKAEVVAGSFTVPDKLQ